MDWAARASRPCEGMKPSELSAAQGVGRNTVSALIASLEEDGFISRALHAQDAASS